MKTGSLKVIDNAPDPYREALADAIVHAEQEREHRNALAAAISRAEQAVTAASARLDEAQAGVRLAQDAQAERLAAASMESIDLPVNQSTRDARVAEAQAQDEVEASQSALAKLQAEYNVDNGHDQRVAEAVRDVIRAASLDTYIFETAKLQDELIKRRLVLYDLAASALIGPATDGDAFNSLMNVTRLPQHFRGQGVLFPGQDIALQVAGREWRAAREALKTDAMVPLPW